MATKKHLTEDSAAAQVGDTGTALGQALSDTYGSDAATMKSAFASSGSASAQRTLTKLAHNTEDVSILIPSDSTAFYTSEEPRWAYYWAELMASDWPTHTVEVHNWNDATPAYSAPLTLQAGTGAHKLKIYVAAVSGSTYTALLGSKFEAAYGSVQPDLVITNLGINDGSTDVTGVTRAGRERILTLTESIRSVSPGSSVIILSQNDRYDVVNSVLDLRATRYAQAAEDLGHGFVDTLRAFREDPRGIAALLKTDQLHPNEAGSRLLAETVYRHTQYHPNLQPKLHLPAAFSQVGGNLLVNSDFSSFAAPPTLPSWTPTNATLSKDVTNFEGPNGYSLRVQAASAAQCRVHQDLNLAVVRGQWLTIAARVWVPSGQANTAGRIEIQAGDGANHTTIGNNAARDGWFWQVVSKRIPTNASMARVLIYGDTSANASADVSFDRVIAVKGTLPRDLR